MDLSVRIGSLTLATPVMSASGCFGYGLEYADVVDLASGRTVPVSSLLAPDRPTLVWAWTPY